MDDIDILLAMVENPTRRRILKSLVREPSYPLRLSKELGISQQAVMKNLALMEQNGLVSSSRVDSSMGPMRILYTPNTEFTLVVEMHDSMFSVKVIGPAGEDAGTADGMTVQEANRRIEEIDGRIEELDKERADLMAERSRITSVVRAATEGSDAEEGTIEKTIGREV